MCSQTPAKACARAGHDMEARAANIRTGYVYAISNVGAFGDRS
jgi:hypothetical protein